VNGFVVLAERPKDSERMLGEIREGEFDEFLMWEDHDHAHEYCGDVAVFSEILMPTTSVGMPPIFHAFQNGNQLASC
jgi:hypothetical protein